MPGSAGGRRPERVADLIREEVASYLIRDIKDPRLGFITVTHVKVTADLSQARVYYSVFGDQNQKAATAEILEASTRALQHHLAKILRMRTIPRIQFFEDSHLEDALKLERLLTDISKK